MRSDKRIGVVLIIVMLACALAVRKNFNGVGVLGEHKGKSHFAVGTIANKGHFESLGHEHFESLASEHDNFTLQWQVSDKDKPTIKALLEELNRPSDDGVKAFPWIWEDVHDNWQFPYTFKTGQDLPGKALALHMMHRHGMSPLYASTHSATFAKTYTNPGGPPTQDKIFSFVEAMELFSSPLFGAMASMDLDSIRNLHAFDHDWSVKKGKGSGCKQQYHNANKGPHRCILQAGFSKRMHDFMEEYGFDSTASIVKLGINQAKRNYTRALHVKSQEQKLQGRLALWAGEEMELFDLYDRRFAK